MLSSDDIEVLRCTRLQQVQRTKSSAGPAHKCKWQNPLWGKTKHTYCQEDFSLMKENVFREYMKFNVHRTVIGSVCCK